MKCLFKIEIIESLKMNLKKLFMQKENSLKLSVVNLFNTQTKYLEFPLSTLNFFI